MPTAKSLPNYPAFGLYPNYAGATETVVAFWSNYARAASGVALWWTDKWIQTPALYGAWAKAAAPATAKIIPINRDVVVSTAPPAAEVVETVMEAPAALAEPALQVVETAVEALIPDPEDLTLLVGIGPKLAAALAERGVTRFAQIAAWTEADLAEIDKALDLKGRAVRDAWVAQAKRFSVS